MKKRALRILAGIMVLLVFCTGCGKTDSSAGQTENAINVKLVPVLDEGAMDLLKDFHLAGSFHEGAAFVGRYTSEEAAFTGGEVECGYVTTQGEYIPLYTAPGKIYLLDPARLYTSLHGDEYLEFETFAFTIFQGMDLGPFVSLQERLDDVLAVGDNGWVPYFENEKWGYCDLEGNIQIQPAYDQCFPFRDGKALVCNYDGQYNWMMINEQGQVVSTFPPQELFAYRLPGELVLLLGKVMSHLYRTDGTPVEEYMDVTSFLAGEESFILRSNVYDAEGNVLYEADDLADIAPYKGKAVYTENEFYGIRGADGEILCSARFAEIYQLAEDGFYAREQGSEKVNKYDYQGNLVEEGAACVRISQYQDGEVLVQDGEGNILAEYACTQESITGIFCGEQTFFTQEGYGYLNQTPNDMLVLHFVFEEKEVSEQETDSQAEPETISLKVEKGEPVNTVNTSLVYQKAGFVSVGFDQLPWYDRINSREGLEWYINTSRDIIFCDENLNTVFTVPRDVVEAFTRKLSNGNTRYPLPENFSYLGEGLWSFGLSFSEEFTKIKHGHRCIFNQDGEIVYERTWQGKTEQIYYNYSCAEGFFFGIERDRFYTKTGEEILIDQTDGVQVHGVWYFNDGLAATDYGYVDTEGHLVIPAQTILDSLEEYTGETLDISTVYLESFDGDRAIVRIDSAVWAETGWQDTSRYYLIDRQGVIQGETQGRPGFETDWDSFFTDLTDPALEKKFRITARPDQSSLLTTSWGIEVSAPEGIELEDDVLQHDEDWAFAAVTNQEGKFVYMLVDGAGNFYPQCSWSGIYFLQNGSYLGSKTVYYEGIGYISEMTLFTVTAE